MTKSKSPGVQHRAIRFARPAPAIFRVAGERMTERRKVHADLVRAPGVEITAQECMRAAFLNDFVSRSRKPSSGDDRHSLAIFRVAADRAFQLAGVGLETSASDRQV